MNLWTNRHGEMRIEIVEGSCHCCEHEGLVCSMVLLANGASHEVDLCEACGVEAEEFRRIEVAKGFHPWTGRPLSEY